MRRNRYGAACAAILFLAPALTTGCLSLGGKTTHVHENPETEARILNVEARLAALEARSAALDATVHGRFIGPQPPANGPQAGW